MRPGAENRRITAAAPFRNRAAKFEDGGEGMKMIPTETGEERLNTVPHPF